MNLLAVEVRRLPLGRRCFCVNAPRSSVSPPTSSMMTRSSGAPLSASSRNIFGADLGTARTMKGGAGRVRDERSGESWRQRRGNAGWLEQTIEPPKLHRGRRGQLGPANYAQL